METELSARCWSSIDEDPFLLVFFRRQWSWMSGAVILMECARTKVGRLGDMAYKMGFSDPRTLLVG